MCDYVSFKLLIFKYLSPSKYFIIIQRYISLFLPLQTILLFKFWNKPFIVHERNEINKFNSTSGLWEFWPEGKFYSSTLDECMDCNGSCRDEWAYQEIWFQWPTGQVFQIGKFDSFYFYFRSLDMDFYILLIIIT